MEPQRKMGCGATLGRLVVIAMLLWPIAQFQPVFHWSDAETGGLELACCALLWAGADLRRRASLRTTPPTDRGRVGAARETCQAEDARPVQVLEARAQLVARERRLNGHWRPPALEVARDPLRGYAPVGMRREPSCRARGHPPTSRAGAQADHGVRRARDRIPAQLRFGILHRDGFRCRYCGRTSSTPGVVLHVDHVVPLAAGGATTEDNLLTACEECNLGKSTRAVLPAGS
jgi:5-methylcytosine-specific restriction endonuclease McrA